VNSRHHKEEEEEDHDDPTFLDGCAIFIHIPHTPFLFQILALNVCILSVIVLKFLLALVQQQSHKQAMK
jgi:hypothetical protein